MAATARPGQRPSAAPQISELTTPPRDAGPLKPPTTARTNRRSQQRTPADTDRRSELTTPADTDCRWLYTLILIAAASSLTLIAHRQTALGMVDLWRRSSAYAYAWLVLPALGFLLWHNRARFANVAPTFCVSAVLPTLLVAALWVIGDLANIALIRELALASSIAAIVLAAVGWRAFWPLAPYVALIFFCVPAGEVLLEPLKTIAVSGVQGYSAILGIPFEQDGFSMVVGASRYVVIDECAGVEHAIAGCFIGLVLALLIYDHPIKVAAFALLGAAAGIASNVIRILGIISYDHLSGSQMTLAEHRYFETPAVVLCFVALLVVFSRLRRPDPRAPRDTGDAAVRPLLKVAAVSCTTLPMLLVSGLGPAALPSAATLDAPSHVLEWKRQDAPLDWNPRVLTPGVDSFVATFSKDGGERSAAVFVAEAKSPRDKVSGGALDLVGTRAWLPAVEERIEACAEARCIDVTHVKLLQGKDGVRHLYVVYIIGGATVATPLAFRIGRAWSALRGRQEPARVVAVAADGPEALPLADVATFVSAFSPE